MNTHKGVILITFNFLYFQTQTPQGQHSQKKYFKKISCIQYVYQHQQRACVNF